MKKLYLIVLMINFLSVNVSIAEIKKKEPPNFLFFFVDDLQAQSLGMNNDKVVTPNIDKLAAQSMQFVNAHPVLSVCSPSRATVLTGRYPSSHGITTFGNKKINPGNPSFIHLLNAAGYQTSVVGKWHLGNSPSELGFKSYDIFHGNGAWYNRKFDSNGKKGKVKEFIETWSADRTINLLDVASKTGKPFFIWHNTQVPHMTSQYTWPATKASKLVYKNVSFELPVSYPPDHRKTGKPPYLKESRSFTKAMTKYGYKEPVNLHQHILDYRASVTDLDIEIGRILDKLNQEGLSENTHIIFMSDNGWMLGDHGLTSKVLAYKSSLEIPMFIKGPGIPVGIEKAFVDNTDIAPTLLELAGVNAFRTEKKYLFHGHSFMPFLKGEKPEQWENYLYYESPTAQLVPRPFFAIKDPDYLYIETYPINGGDVPEFIELYDNEKDPDQMHNLALLDSNQYILTEYSKKIKHDRTRFKSVITAPNLYER